MKVWLQACRVNSLAISSIGVMVGTAVAVHDGRFYLTRFLLAWLGSVLIQAGTNLTNVFYNYKAASASADPASFDPRGSSSVLRLGLLTPEQVRRGGLLSFAAGILCGLLLAYLCGWTILWLGFARSRGRLLLCGSADSLRIRGAGRRVRLHLHGTGDGWRGVLRPGAFVFRRRSCCFHSDRLGRRRNHAHQRSARLRY